MYILVLRTRVLVYRLPEVASHEYFQQRDIFCVMVVFFRIYSPLGLEVNKRLLIECSHPVVVNKLKEKPFLLKPCWEPNNNSY